MPDYAMNNELEKVKHTGRLVRSQATGRYFTDGGIWVDRINDATDWQEISQAVHLCQQYNLADVELILESDRNRCQLSDVGGS